MTKWVVVFHPEFYEEFNKFSITVQDTILAKSLLLEQFGPHLGRPHVDTLFGSRYSNMKELRLDSDKGTWRVAFAFDPKRKVVLLVAGDKAGASQKAFYINLIRKADNRFYQHLNSLHEN
jgi:hypothetical protein